MATHDYVIDNQTAPNFRADLNNAFSAIVSQNSNATAPSTTYANMLWYDTTNNQLKKRNEANSGWIILGTIDEALGTFLPNALANQAEAEAGTSNTVLMTSLRVSQAVTAQVTTSSVLALISGAAVGAVGTYAFLSPTSTSTIYNPGDTLAGSSLKYSGSESGGLSVSSTSPAGTWRIMGYKDATGVVASLWLRIS